MPYTAEFSPFHSKFQRFVEVLFLGQLYFIMRTKLINNIYFQTSAHERRVDKKLILISSHFMTKKASHLLHFQRLSAFFLMI